MYNDLIKIILPRDVELIAFVDDVMVIAKSGNRKLLEEKLEDSFDTVSRWMQVNRLELAEHRTEAIVLTRRYIKNKIQVKCDNTIVESSKSIKYLGLVIDQKLNFKEHANQTVNKVVNIQRQLGYILPNIGGTKQSKNKVLATEVTSKLLHEVPCWERYMVEGAWKEIETKQRKIGIKIA